jgi:F0F1-type ATP synthase gamma subunit
VDEDEAKGYFLDDKKHLCVVITTDKGLCGSVNSSIARSMRREILAAQVRAPYSCAAPSV